MKSTLKKFLSITLVVSMLMSMCTFAFATWENQVVSNGELVTTENEKVQHSKLITQTGENAFRIDLTVKTKEDIQTQTVYQDAAVVLVLDVSNSMTASDIEAAKNAANGFVSKFIENAGEGQRKVAVVEFGSNAKTLLGWTEAKSGSGVSSDVTAAIGNVSNKFSYTEMCEQTGEHTHEENIKRSVNDIEYRDYAWYSNDGWYCIHCDTRVSTNGQYNKPTKVNNHSCKGDVSYTGTHVLSTGNDTGGTNIEGGLRLANNLLDTVSGIGNKYVVLMTDGVPSYHVEDSDETNSTTFMKGTRGGGDEAKHADYHDIYCTENQSNHVNHGDNVPQQIKNKGAKLYTVSYKAANVTGNVNNMSIDSWLAAFATQNISAGDNIFSGLGNIAQIIVNQAQAWILTDPMGEYINFVSNDGIATVTNGTAGSSDAVKKFNTDTKTLTWDLKNDATRTGPVDGWYTYTMSYNITLDTAAEGFKEDQGYAANGTTTLTYMLTENGQLQPDLKDTELVVPVVEGKVPNVPYTVTYWYKDKTTGEYKSGKQVSDTGKLFDTITIGKDDYHKDHYTFKEGNEGKQTLRLTGNNFNMYYDPIPVTVVVNHWVVTETTKDEGVVVTGPEKVDTDTYSTNLWEGDSFTNTEFLDSETYKQVASVQDAEGTTYTTDKYKNVDLNAPQTVINIYYVEQAEARTPVDYEVHYAYRTGTWELKNGKYELVYGDYAEDASQKITGTNWLNSTVSFPDYSKKNTSYTLDKVQYNGEDNSGNFSIKLGDKGNVVNVYYTIEPQDTRVPATLTIAHVYWKTTVDGNIFESYETEKNAEKVYVGETYTASSLTKDGTYKRTTADAAMEITIANGSNYVEIEYIRDARVPATVIVNHYYTDYEWNVDSTTGVGTWVEKETSRQSDLKGIRPTDRTYYEGEIFVPTQIPAGYTLNEAWSDEEGRVLSSGKNEFNLFYESRIGEEVVADVTVNHIYQTFSSYVNAKGEIVRNELSSKTVSEDKIYGIPGESFTAAKREDGFTFVSADTDDLTVTLQGENGQYNIYYQKDDNRLEEVTVKVQPIYKTYSTELDGTVVLTSTEKNEAVTLEGTYYKGQKVTVSTAAYAKGDFTFDPDDAENTPNATIEHLGAGDNGILVVYKQVVDNRTPASVVIRNHYELVIESSDEKGVYSKTTDSWSNTGAVYGGYYVGQTFDTTGKGTANGYGVDSTKAQPEATIPVDQQITYVDFYWYKEVDQTNPAEVEVVHHYTIKDKNPNAKDIVWMEGENLNKLGNVFYAGQSFAAAPNYQSDIFTKENITKVIPDGAIEADGIVLHSGKNVIDIYYVKTVDTRVNTTAKVVHNYYHDAEALAEGTTEATYVENPSVLEADSYTATKRTENQSIAYVVDSADPTDYTITVDKDAAKNVITISYVRADSKYTVVHEYYKNGSLVGSTTSEKAAKAGDEIKDSDIEKVTTYEGVTYNFSSATPSSIVVAADGSSVITLRYNRTTGGGGGGGGYTPTPKPDPIPEPPVDDEEIVDEDVPLAALPVPGDEELEDFEEEEVPLANVPKTSDMALFWLASSALSGIGLGALNLKKREDEDEQ